VSEGMEKGAEGGWEGKWDGVLALALRILGRAVQEASARMSAWPGALGEVEKMIQRRVREAGALLFEASVASAGRGYEGSRGLCRCGGTSKYMGDRERDMVSLLGKTRLRRAYYWCPQCGQGRAPLDERLGIAGTDFSPGVREAIGLVGADVAFQPARTLLGRLAGVWVSARKHREVSESLVQSAGAALEGHPVRGTVEGADPQRAPDLYLLADGVMAPIRGGWREVKLGAVFAAPPRRKRQEKGKRKQRGKPDRGRARFFGDVMEAEAFGEQWYRWAEVMGLGRARRVIVLGDGAAWIWNQAQTHFPGAILIVDFYHALERLWTVAHAVWGEADPRAASWVRSAKAPLRRGDIPRVVALLRDLPARNNATRKIIEEAAGYYANNADRMRYRHFRRQGLFTGSGVVEAACKRIVAQRLKGTGMRWNLEGLRSILALRLAIINGDWPAAVPRAA